MKNRHTNTINIILAFLLLGGISFALYALMEHDKHKEQLLARAEVLSESMRSTANNYDKLLGTEYSKQVTQFALDQGKKLESIRTTLKLLEGQQRVVKNYRETLTNALVTAVTQLKLPGYEKANELEALSKGLSSAITAPQVLDELEKKFIALKLRDDQMMKAIVDLGDNLRIELDINQLISLEKKYDQVFRAIEDKIQILKARSAQYEKAFTDIADAAGVAKPQFTNDVSISEQVEALTAAIKAKQQELASKKREKSKKEGELSELIDLIAEQERSIATETENKIVATAKRHELGSHVWTTYDGQDLNLISPESYDRCYKLFLPKVSMLNFDLGLVQFDAGLANVAQFPIGDKNRTQKIKAPILPAYDLEYCRQAKDGSIKVLAILRATQVGEYTTIARIVKVLTKTLSPMQKGDFVRYSTHTIDQIMQDKSAQTIPDDVPEF